MKPREVMIIASAVFTSRCTHIRQVQSFDDINKAAAGKLASMTLTNGRVLFGKALQVAMDSTFWLDEATGRKQSMATSEIGKVVISLFCMRTKAKTNRVMQRLGNAIVKNLQRCFKPQL